MLQGPLRGLLRFEQAQIWKHIPMISKHWRESSTHTSSRRENYYKCRCGRQVRHNSKSYNDVTSRWRDNKCLSVERDQPPGGSRKLARICVNTSRTTASEVTLPHPVHSDLSPSRARWDLGRPILLYFVKEFDLSIDLLDEMWGFPGMCLLRSVSE